LDFNNPSINLRNSQFQSLHFMKLFDPTSH